MRAGTFAIVSLLVACDNPEPAATKDRQSAQAPPILAPSSSDRSYEDETSTRPMELLKFKFTSGVEGREPVDELTFTKPGQRVYAHFTIRNRTGRKRSIHLVFTVNGQKRTEVDLDVEESWSFRTWAYNTVLAKDTKGKLDLEVTDDEGNGLVDATLPIK